MNMILFENEPKESTIPMTDERALHIRDVLHLKEGDTFKMGIVNLSQGNAVIRKIDETGIQYEYTAKDVPSMYPVTLLVAHVRPICMKRILREAVSLGVGTILLTGSETGEKSYLASGLFKTGEYKEYLLDGAMQACSAGVSRVLFADCVKDAVKIASENNKEDTSFIMLDNVSGSEALSKSSIQKNAVLAIGPERGWTESERSIFVASGYESMLLGPRVLRTETACSAGIAVLLSRMNYM